MASMERNMNQVIDGGRQLIDEGIPGSEQIATQIEHVEDQWNALRQLADARKQRLLGGVDYYQVDFFMLFKSKLREDFKRVIFSCSFSPIATISTVGWRILYVWLAVKTSAKMKRRFNN